MISSSKGGTSNKVCAILNCTENPSSLYLTRSISLDLRANLRNRMVEARDPRKEKAEARASWRKLVNRKEREKDPAANQPNQKVGAR